MTRMFLTAGLLAASVLAGAASPVLARDDGHGNAEMMERSVPNTGGVSGGPLHRDSDRQGGRVTGTSRVVDDGHGNAEDLTRPVPSLGGVSGGPRHGH